MEGLLSTGPTPSSIYLIHLMCSHHHEFDLFLPSCIHVDVVWEDVLGGNQRPESVKERLEGSRKPVDFQGEDSSEESEDQTNTPVVTCPGTVAAEGGEIHCPVQGGEGRWKGENWKFG